MMMRFLLLLSVLLMLCYSSFPQEYSYTHYDIKEGLAGSNVYCITQDKQGFLWMGTEGGLSRFDGTHFKNFSLEDGLPDIEVLQIFADSRGRIWMGPFSKSVCFYFDGRIHNQRNDTVLKKIRVTGNIESFAEDRDGNILMQERTVLHLVTPSGQVRDITRIGETPLLTCTISADSTGHFLIQNRGSIYRWADGNFTWLFSYKNIFEDPLYVALNARLFACRGDTYSYTYRSLQTGKTDSFYFDGDKSTHVSYSLAGDSLIYNNETSGTTEYNIFTGATRHFAVGGKISRTFRDDEGNLWFTSLGQGVFRLNSDEIRNIPLWSKISNRCVVRMIRKIDKELFVGTSNSMLFRYASPSLKDAGIAQVVDAALNDVNFACRTKNGRLFVGTTMRLYSMHSRKFEPVCGIPIKSVVLKNDSEALVAGRTGIFLIDIKQPQVNGSEARIKHQVWTDRVTVIYYANDLIYAGTLDGLYVIRPDKSFEYWGDRDPVFSRRISSIAQGPDGVLWFATYGGGIIAWKNGCRVAKFTHKQGLSSDLCRTIEVHGKDLWVGTDKGLNRVDLGNPEHPVTSYTSEDGLGSDMINVICVDSPRVYVGTPAGLSFFDADHVHRSAGCRLVMLSVASSGKERVSDTTGFTIPYDRNNIRFEYAGISYKSAENISYRYRLLGLDSVWKTTKESFLDYPTLPSGDYELQLQAINKFGVESRQQSIRFSVATPFWKTIWFDALALLLFVMLTWLFITLRIRQLRRRQAEKEELHKRLAETEHMALQAQMNPHFIFNCLNSIQQYIFDQDIFAANKYITGFAKLIRATLHNSSKPTISLAEEVDYLSSYLSLEKLRFKEKMDYTIEVAPLLREDLENIHIPPMLIQPYVENSMRHGLRHKTGGGGYIRINIMPEGDKLKFIIEDNGIGREQAARYKTREHIEYQSKGMSLTADRIRLINTTNGDSIRVEVLDITDTNGRAGGTRVIVWFPGYTALFKEGI